MMCLHAGKLRLSRAPDVGRVGRVGQVGPVRRRAAPSVTTHSSSWQVLHGVEHGLDNVDVTTYEGMTVDFVRSTGSRVILKGMRTVSDFENEFQQALTNRALDSEIETVFIMTKQDYAFFRATHVKEVARLGGNLKPFVPPLVERLLVQKARELGPWPNG